MLWYMVIIAWCSTNYHVTVTMLWDICQYSCILFDLSIRNIINFLHIYKQPNFLSCCHFFFPLFFLSFFPLFVLYISFFVWSLIFIMFRHKCYIHIILSVAYWNCICPSSSTHNIILWTLDISVWWKIHILMLWIFHCMLWLKAFTYSLK